MLRTRVYELAISSFQKKILLSPFANKTIAIAQLVVLKYTPNAAHCSILLITKNSLLYNIMIAHFTNTINKMRIGDRIRMAISVC